MVKETYCSCEVSELLKKKGFDYPNLHGLESDINNIWIRVTHQMAMAWLRERSIYVYVQPTKYVGGALYGFQAVIEDGRNDKWEKHVHHSEYYEEAVEAAIMYCLENLI